MSVMRMRHWFSALDHNGTLPDEALQQLRRRFGGAAPAGVVMDVAAQD
jgi:hypothetical protein